MRSQSLLILTVVAIVLVLATLAGSFLRVLVRQTGRSAGAPATVDNLNTRIKSWWVIVFVLGGAALAGRTAVIILFAAISFIALREFLALTILEAGDHRVVVATVAVALPLQFILIGSGHSGWFVGFLPVAGLPLISVLLILTGKSGNYLARTAELLTGLLVCVYCISYVPALLNEDDQGLLMIFLILAAQTSDILQYVFGKLAGRHKIAPRISPSKTIEGLLGGILGVTALGAVLYRMTPFTVTQAGILAFATALAGFVGGLIMSAIKRDRGVKDWSQLIPGHGGMLDRLDSLWLSAPLFYHLTRMFFAQIPRIHPLS